MSYVYRRLHSTGLSRLDFDQNPKWSLLLRGEYSSWKGGSLLSCNYRLTGVIEDHEEDPMTEADCSHISLASNISECPSCERYICSDCLETYDGVCELCVKE